MANIYKLGSEEALSALDGSSCAFGVFDGVHRGHRFLLESALRDEGSSVVLTFDVDPDELFRPDTLKKLMSNRVRIESLAESGVDAVVVLPFSHKFAGLSPEEFLSTTFERSLPRHLHVGADFRFGKSAVGTAETLRAWGDAHGCVVRAHDLFSEEGAPVTATRIRTLLGAGSIEDANRLLGHAYALEGPVVEGRHEGQEMGFRTANLHVPEQLDVLGAGVYAAYASVDGVRYKAAVSVGVAPTFADTTTANVEAHLLDFDGDLYGKTIVLEFARWLRPMMKFDSVEELIRTVMGNIDWVRSNL